MKSIYSPKEIKEKLSCIAYAESQGAEIRNGRTKAWWRGGDNWNISIEDAVWYDFVTKQGGSVIDLCALVEHGEIGATMSAIRTLGERLNLQPVCHVKAMKKTRSEVLLADGYKTTAVYDYREENGTLRYQIVRFEKTYGDGHRDKEFVHRTPDHEGLDPDTPKLLYNLPAVTKASEVYVVEGEKDADTLISLGLVATTNSGGAANWDSSLTRHLADKDVVVICDNDDAGRRHGEVLSAALASIAHSVKRLTPSALPKGDVTDWIEKEGGSLQKLRDLVKDSESQEEIEPNIAAAKLANEYDFSNYRELDGSKGRRKTTIPASMDEILKELSVRFLGYPRNLGGELFDWQRKTKEVMFISNPNSLFAWIQRTSHRPVMWQSGTGCVTRTELYEAILQTAKKYTGVSSAPHYPLRDDIFYTYDKLPPPDPTHSTFWNLIGRFLPATDPDRTLIAAFFLAPLFYSDTATHPMWIIDTVDAQGSGKSTLVKACAHLYGNPAIAIDPSQLERDMDQIIKRLISTEGRQSRVVLLDNVTKVLGSPNLAALVTYTHISGRPAYGRGEERRPNDITYVATVNGATVNSDIAIRCYTVRVRAPANADPLWETNVFAYIKDNRRQLYADMLHMVGNNHIRMFREKSRFALFDQTILSAACRTVDEFNAVEKHINGCADEANVDGDHAEEFMEILETMLAGNERFDLEKGFFILNRDIDYLLRNSDGALQRWTSAQIWGLVKQGRCRNISRTCSRIWKNDQGIAHLRGMLYIPESANPDTGPVAVQVLSRNASRFSVLGEIYYNKPKRGN